MAKHPAPTFRDADRHRLFMQLARRLVEHGVAPSRAAQLARDALGGGDVLDPDASKLGKRTGRTAEAKRVFRR